MSEPVDPDATIGCFILIALGLIAYGVGDLYGTAWGCIAVGGFILLLLLVWASRLCRRKTKT